MRCWIVVFCVLMLGASATADEDDGVIVSRVRPETLYAEARGPLTRLNFDIELVNRSDEAVRLTYLDLRVFDRDNQVLTRRYIGANGLPGPITMLPQREIAAGGTLYLFNPFPDLALADSPARLRLRIFHTAGAVTIDEPLRQPPGPRLTRPPLDAVSFIYAGSDLLSHHRRVSLASDAAKALGLEHVAQRFALDFTMLDPRTGDLARTNGHAPDDWFAFDAPVYAPLSGNVVAARANRPDNTFDQDGQRIFAPGYERSEADASLGNYLMLQVEQSYLLISHFRQDTLRVRVGDAVRAGDFLGRLGMSGDTAYPHLHVQLQDGPDLNTARPLPIMFECVRIGGADERNRALDAGDFAAPCAP